MAEEDQITVLHEPNAGKIVLPKLPDKIIVIGDAAMVTGFRLAGITEAYVAEGRDAEKKLTELLSREDAGIIILSERVLALVDWRLKKRIESLAKPAVVGIPDKTGQSEDVESLNSMIKRALGFEFGKK